MSDQQSQPSIHIDGGVHGQNVLVGSTQTVHGDFTIAVGAASGPEDLIAQLKEQTAALTAALVEVPASHQDDVDDVHLAAEDAVAEIEKDEVDPERVAKRAGKLRRAAERFAEVAPSVFAFATQIAATVEQIAS